MNSKICLIYNFAQHYRTNIFTLLDQNLDIDFVFGDKYLNVKKMDYSCLKHNVIEVRNQRYGPFLWQKGVIGLVFKGYSKYVLLGEPMNISYWFLCIVGRLTGKKIYFWTHGWYGKETRLRAVIKKLFFNLANGVLLYGNYARKLMINEGFTPQRLSVIYNSLNYDEQLKLRNGIKPSELYKVHFKNENPVLIMIGRLNLRKHLDMLVDAIALLNRKGEHYNVVYVGDGEDRDKIERLSIEKGIMEQSWFYGACYDESTNSELLFNADMCVVPGDVGLTAIHSMMFGVPVISHNCFQYQGPEFEAIIPGKTGDYYEYGSIQSLAETISKWFDNMGKNRQLVRHECFNEVDAKWNPHVQLDIIKKAIGE